MGTEHFSILTKMPYGNNKIEIGMKDLSTYYFVEQAVCNSETKLVDIIINKTVTVHNQTIK